MNKQNLSLIIILLIGTNIFAQRKCISHEKHLEQLISNPNLISETQKLEAFTQERKKNAKTSEVTYTIPIVVHVINNGELVGVGQNISDEQIFSQIKVLNEDFRLLNPDKLGINHPFFSTIADCGIEFVLANRDESGAFSTGITRTDLFKATWTFDDFEAVVKPLTAWDRTKYLNIWITTLGGADEGTLGYASFPGTDDASDGVVIGAKYFGTTGFVENPYHLGRTASHEIGHYLNLSHIWGDAECGDDLVSDTEPAFESNSGCPIFPHNANNSCGALENGEMYMNYMDYSNDSCLNMFTTGQKERMRATLESSRASLLTSSGISVNEISASYSSIYPNPAQNTVTIAFSKQITVKSVTVYCQSGQVVNHLTSSNFNEKGVTINTTSLNNGNYFVKIEGENQIIHQQFVIIK